MHAADRFTVGLTPQRTVIEGFAVSASTAAPTIVLLGGLDGDATSARMVRDAMRKYDASAPRRRRFRLLAVPLANPDKARLVFPPPGAAYKENAESHYLWRWIGIEAPDLVLIAGAEDFGLAAALPREAVAGIGRVPARRGMLAAVPKLIPPSEARREIERRLARSPREVAELLARRYGHELADAVYIPAVAVIGRLRLGNAADVRRLAEPYLDGSKDSLARPSGSHLAGHLLFAELAAITGDKRAIARVRAAADLGVTTPLHNEMSDAVFMSCPILAAAGKLTGEQRYFDLTLSHLRFMEKLCLRPDGIYRHSPLDQAAWGRGNGFPALGLALALSDTPPQHAAFDPMRLAFQNLIAALARFQGDDGMWRQVIDVPGAYPEFTATAMIATAMLRGVRRGWLAAESYQPRVDKAWRALQRRIADDGTLIDVCESTGKQKALDDYLRRVANFERDPRGGAMALLLATEMVPGPNSR